MYTRDEAIKWGIDHHVELEKSFMESDVVPNIFKKLDNPMFQIWKAGCWLDEMLRNAGASDEENTNICFVLGQRSFFEDPWKWAIHYANEFKQKKFVSDNPGVELADMLNKKHLGIQEALKCPSKFS